MRRGVLTLLAFAWAALASAGCSLWGPRFIDRGQDPPVCDVEQLKEKGELLPLLQERLSAVHTLKCHGVDATFSSPRERFGFDLAVFLLPPDRARAIISKGIIGAVADILAVGREVRYYLPTENELHVLHLRAEDVWELKSLPWSVVFGIRPSDQPVVFDPTAPIVETKDALILQRPLEVGHGNSERLTFDRKTLLLRSRVIVQAGRAPLARVEFNHWRQMDGVWWPLRADLRLPRSDIDIRLWFSRSPDKTRPNADLSPEVFELDVPDDAKVIEQWYPEL